MPGAILPEIACVLVDEGEGRVCVPFREDVRSNGPVLHRQIDVEGRSLGGEITPPRWPRTRQGDKEAIAGNEAVRGQPDLRGAARCHQTRELLELMKPSQMWFRIGQKPPARLGQMR